MNYMFVMKLVDWKMDRYTVFEVVEESLSSPDFLIRARNNFKSYSNYAEAVVNDTASMAIKATAIKEVFGLDYARLESTEKRMVWLTFIKRATLEIVEESAGVALSLLLGEARMDEKNSMFAKTLTMSRMDTPLFKRIWVGGEYRLPLTIQLVAFSGEILGVSLRLYFPTQSRDDGGVLLIPNRTYEAPATKDKKKKWQVNGPAEYAQKFGLISLLQVKGFDLLAKSLVHRPTSMQPVLRIQSQAVHSQLAPLDSILSLSHYL